MVGSYYRKSYGPPEHLQPTPQAKKERRRKEKNVERLREQHRRRKSGQTTTDYLDQELAKPATAEAAAAPEERDKMEWTCDRTLEGGTGAMLCVSVLGTGSRCAGAGDEGIVRIWDLGTGELLVSVGGGERCAPILSLAWVEDGGRVLAGGMDGRLAVWRVAGGVPVRRCGVWGGLST